MTIGTIFDLPANVGILVLSRSEGSIIADEVAIDEGKKKAILDAAPLAQVHELSQITTAKSLLFKLYNRLFHAYGAQNFTTIFQHSGREFDRTHERVTIGNFTDGNLFSLINNRLRTTIDPTLTLDGFQVSPNEALALSQLALGQGLKDTPSSKYIIRANLQHGNPPSSIAQRIQNLECLFGILSLLFNDWFVDRLRLLVPQIQTTLRPSSGEEFSNLFDCFTKAIGQVSEAQSTSLVVFQTFVTTTLDLSEGNQLVASWRRDKLALAAAEQQLQMDKLQMEMDVLRATKDVAPLAARLVPNPPPKRKMVPMTMDEKARIYNVTLDTYKTSRPITLPSNVTIDLCPRVARGDTCLKHKIGRCDFIHKKDPKWMTLPYVKWCVDMPTFGAVASVKKTKI